MTDVVLSGAGRNNLLSQQNTADLPGKTQEPLAADPRVSSAADDPTEFFTASSLNSRASDLNGLLESVALAVQTLEAADNAIAEITNLVESAQAIALQALQTASGASGAVASAGDTEGTTLETRFNDLRTQIDQLAADAGFNGVNLLQSDNLTVNFNDDPASSLTISGVNFDSAGLSITAAVSGSFQNDAEINNTLSELDAAAITLRSQAATFGSNLSVVETRQNFTENLVYVLETGAAGLTLADTNAEGANLLALQTRHQLSSVAPSLASQSDQNVLRLF